MSIRAHNTNRANTNLMELVAEDTLKMNATLVTIPKSCDSFALTTKFKMAIACADGGHGRTKQTDVKEEARDHISGVTWSMRVILGGLDMPK
jgi:hypothetical protein